MFKTHLKIAWRNLQKRKVFALINVLGLALGFACGILIFLFVNHHLQYDNFHENEDRIYRIVTEEHRDGIGYETAVPPGFAKAFRTDYDYAEKVSNTYFRDDWQINSADEASQQRFKENLAFTEPSFFEIFNFPLLEKLGERTLLEPKTAYVTEKFAKKMFVGENALGKTFVLENLETIQVIGILKDLPENSMIDRDLFISYPTIKSYDEFVASETWGGINGSLRCYALLHPNQDIAHIEQTLIELVDKHRPKSKNVHRYKLQPLHDIHFNSNYDGINVNLLWIFSLVGIFLITVACINFVNISTAQAFTRSKEIGIKKVLGSNKKYLFWQFITETFIISVLAMGIGLLITMTVLPSFNDLFDLNLSIFSLLDIKVVLLIIVLLAGVSFFAGSYPGILLARILPTLALKGKLTQKDAGGQLTRKVLVTAQFIISILLIVGTVVIGKQISYAVNADLGFDKDAVVMLNIPEDLEHVKIEGLKERIAQLAGVESVTACLASPGAAYNIWGTSVKYNNRPEFEEFSISAKMADEDYINTFGLDLVAGRNFKMSDSITEVVVNEKLAQKLGLGSPDELVGKIVTLNGGFIKATVSGVVANFHDQNFHLDISPVFIAPQTNAFSELAIKINGRDTKNTLTGIEQRWREVFPKYIYEYNFLDSRVAELYNEEQRLLSLSRLFSGLAIFISCLGLYGLISFFVAQRTKEVGIRKVLGSNVSGILILFMKDFFKLILIAGAIATPLAWYFMSRWLENYKYRTEMSWWIFVVSISGLLLITMITISYQAIKAATANPINSLRSE
ncbi:ABC transporter permease [Aquimarina sp. D1M17]|uniref:ABC transporter permease n=1 Tax=Aquimarina acroporae TaxID=2937283 RepID=UPI0020C066D9|nr:ABC transporter permease [Aquimarina acroporae]MCK8523161.1 ABC transporter permease [Aquimarina acroporae]